MTNIDTVLDYHEQTKHYYRRYARSIGYLDWANKPYAYREYTNTSKLPLKLCFDNETPLYKELFTDPVDAKDINYETISQFLQFSMGLAAKKSTGSDSWELRCNASSGNLHPTESYILTTHEDQINASCGVFHYNPYKHELERVADTPTALLENDTFLIGISSILYREIWKYGERAFRYTQLDAGHALRSFEISALMLGWNVKVLEMQHEEAEALFGLNHKDRFIAQEREDIDMVLQISMMSQKSINPEILSGLISNVFVGKVNLLASEHQSWELIDSVEDASSKAQTISSFPSFSQHTSNSEQSSKDVVLKRRSAQMMDLHRSQISKTQFLTLLNSVGTTGSKVHLAVFINNVEELESGLYLYLRDEEKLTHLKENLRSTFLYQKSAPNLYLLELGDYKQNSKNISCSQEIASDGAFSLGMLCEFEENIKLSGALEYKKLYWECGSIGQQLYLEATSLSLSATGIGCFLDDAMHSLLGVKERSYQVLYHFTIGRAIVDMRLQNLHPYSHLIS